MRDKPLVLVVEDSHSWQSLYSDKVHDQMRDGVELVIAGDLEAAHAGFTQYQHELAAIVLDACVGSRELNSVGFLEFVIASGFVGPIIAASSRQEHRNTLVRLGCTHSCEKGEVFPEMVTNVLNL